MDMLKMKRDGLSRIILPMAIYIFYSVIARDPWVILITAPSFLAIACFSIMEEGKYVNENDIINAICFIFFVVSPLQSIDKGQFSEASYASGLMIGYGHIIMAQAIFLIFYVTYMFITTRTSSKGRIISFQIKNGGSIIIFFILLASFILHIYANGGVTNLLAPRYGRIEEYTNITALGWKAIIISSEITLFVTGFGYGKSTPLQKGLSLFGAILLAISVNPFNIARNVLFNAWFPIFIVMLKGRVRAIYLHMLFVLLIIFIYPIVNFTSREGYSVIESLGILVDSFRYSIKNPFSDVFDTLVSAVWWFDSQDFFHGEKTLGLLLFLIPRELWTGKATLMGLDIGEYFYSAGYTGTPNLSFFIGGDFYADFGLPGVLFGGILTACVVYLAVYKRSISVNGWRLKSLLFMGALPILIRGPVGANVGLFFFELLFVSLLFRSLPSVFGHTILIGGANLSPQRRRHLKLSSQLRLRS